MKERWSLVIHAVLLLGGVCAYFKQPDDVVWQFVRGESNVRVWERIWFALAAVALAISLSLRVRLDTQPMESKNEQGRAGPLRIASDFLQALGIGSLLPIAGFILLVLGETTFSVLCYAFENNSGSELAGTAVPRSATTGRGERRESLSRHAGLLCAFLSMVAFSITLSDRLADYLFAGSALIAVLANLRRRRTWY
jgi:hypothetical protein